MNVEVMIWAIYASLAVSYAVSIHGMTYRLLHVDFKMRLCPEESFYEILIEHLADDWRGFKQRWAVQSGQLGWLSDCFQARTAPRAAAAAESAQRQQTTYLSALRLVCSLSTLLGLLGTVCAFLIAKDVSNVGLNTAFVTTFWGILIGVPPAIYLSITHVRRQRFEAQIEQFLERLKGLGQAPLEMETATVAEVVEFDPAAPIAEMVEPDAKGNGQPANRRWKLPTQAKPHPFTEAEVVQWLN